MVWRLFLLIGLVLVAGQPRITLYAGSPQLQEAVAASEKTLVGAAAKAAKLKQPLIVWVAGFESVELQAVTKRCVHVRVKDWKGKADPGVLVCPVLNGWPHSSGLISPREKVVPRALEEMQRTKLLIMDQRVM